MKTNRYILLLLTIISLQLSKAQEASIHLPKVENYTHGLVEIKVLISGLNDPISIGKITEDGTIHFAFPETFLKSSKEHLFDSAQNISSALGMFVCHDKEITEETKTTTAIEVKDLLLYKYGQRVGALLSASNKVMLENEFTLGSKLLLVLSSDTGVFRASCTVYENDVSGNGTLEKTNIKNTTSYDIRLKKGWNMVEQKLLKTKTLEDNRGTYKRRLIEQKSSVNKIPTTINWYIKYWANDAYLEIEQQLITKAPITAIQYENWTPKKLGKLKRTAYQIGKTIERLPTLNNIELHFEKGPKKATVTIVDCVANKSAASVYTLMLDMASSDWKDKTKTGYRSASNIDGTRVLIDYNEAEAKTTMNFNANNRFLVKAEAVNITPELLWNALKTLNLNVLHSK